VFRQRNTVFLRDTHGLWKTLGLLLPEEEFHPEHIAPVGVAPMRPLLILIPRRKATLSQALTQDRVSVVSRSRLPVRQVMIARLKRTQARYRCVLVALVADLMTFDALQPQISSSSMRPARNNTRIKHVVDDPYEVVGILITSTSLMGAIKRLQYQLHLLRLVVVGSAQMGQSPTRKRATN
jgi:hypothetical protein